MSRIGFFHHSSFIAHRLSMLAMAFAAALMLAGCGGNATVKELNVVPEPVFMIQKEGSYTLAGNPKVSLTSMGQNTPTAKYIMKSMRSVHLHPSLVPTGSETDIDLVINDTVNTELGEEGYLLEVRNTGIRLSANTETGLFYAYQTFVQLLPPDVTQTAYRSITLPECTILDYPRFAWRGAHLDVSRHFFPVKFVKKYLDVMASYKLNKFHWHLTDDHGWRLPSESWPALNSVGSWRVDREGVPWGKAEPAHEGERRTYGGWYTREEIADVVEYAAARGIEVIPEIDIPGHASAILASYPSLACDDYPYDVAIGPYWPPKAILCAGNDSTLLFLKQVLDEVCELFPSRYVHIGGDEAVKDNWRECPKCQRRIRTEHLHGEEGLQGWLMAHLRDYLVAKGKVAVCWDEVVSLPEPAKNQPAPRDASLLHGNTGKAAVPDTMVVTAWRGFYAGLEAAKEGFNVVMCPTEFCYLDYYQADVRYQPKSIGGMVTLSKAYSFDPVPEGTSPQVARRIIGGQCNLWTEYINTPSHAEYMLLPRMLAIGESLWTPKEKKDWNHFRRRVEAQKERLHARGYNYCEGSFTPRFTAHRTDDHTTNVAISTEVPNTYIFYTTDLSTPTKESAIYLGPMNLERGTHIKILPVYKDQPRDSVYEFVIQ